jgi:hypothetical protein
MVKLKNYIGLKMEKKQSSIEWLIDQIKNVENQKNLTGAQWMDVVDQAKAMHKEEIVKAYDRDVINKKQNWAIENGERYYNLHYKEEQVGKTS